MDWDRTENDRDVGALLGWAGMGAGVLGMIANALSCVFGPIGTTISVALTITGLVLSVAAVRRGKHLGDAYSLGVIGVSFSVINMLVLCVLMLVQCYLFGVLALLVAATR